jgi:hypothetical protein
MPVILATWEAEIRQIVVPGQSRQKIHETLSQPMDGHSGVYLSSQLFREAQIGGSRSSLALAKSETLSQK